MQWTRLRSYRQANKFRGPRALEHGERIQLRTSSVTRRDQLDACAGKVAGEVSRTSIGHRPVDLVQRVRPVAYGEATKPYVQRGANVSAPEGTRVPPLLLFLAPSVGRRREQGSPFASLPRIIRQSATFKLLRPAAADDFGARFQWTAVHLRAAVQRIA